MSFSRHVGPVLCDKGSIIADSQGKKPDCLINNVPLLLIEVKPITFLARFCIVGVVEVSAATLRRAKKENPYPMKDC